MKKIFMLIFTLLLIIPVSVYAAATPQIITLEAESDESTINYNGTIDFGMTAVMCKLYNSSSEEVDKFSTAVEDNKFNGSFENVEDGDYTIYCANYEGGEIKKVDVTVGTTGNPKTFDVIYGWVLISIVSIIGMYVSFNKYKRVI